MYANPCIIMTDDILISQSVQSTMHMHMLVVNLLAVWLIVPGSAIKIVGTEWDIEKFKEEVNKQLRNPVKERSGTEWQKELECIGCQIFGNITQGLFAWTKEDEVVSDLIMLCDVLKYLPLPGRRTHSLASFCSGILSEFKVSVLHAF